MTRVVRLGVMPMRPREVVPMPRYWVIVIEATRLVFNYVNGRGRLLLVLPSIRACHWMCRTTLSEPLICCQNIGPRFGAAWARIPLRFAGRYLSE
jgi:hypothetical protein